MTVRTKSAAILMACAVGGPCFAAIPSSPILDPEAQIVATVDEIPITAAEVARERQAMPASATGGQDPDQVALQQIITRRVVVRAARAMGLDKTVEFARQMRRGEEAVLTQTYQQAITARIPAPTPQEVGAFIAAHPEKFGRRKIWVIDQIVARPANQDVQRFLPLHSLEAITALLDKETVQYERRVVNIDSLTADPQLVNQMEKLPSGEVILTSNGGTMFFGRIGATREAPFSGELANTYAIEAIRSQATQAEMRKLVDGLIKAAMPSIVFMRPPAPGATRP
jgi:hypothetical protein